MKYRALSSCHIAGAQSIVNRLAVASDCRIFPAECRALLIEHRALLSCCKVNVCYVVRLEVSRLF